MTAMATPLRIAVTVPPRTLRFPTTLPRITQNAPVQPSFPPPQYLLDARPTATAKASGGGGASSCGAKRPAVGTKRKAAKINLTEYLARYQLKRNSLEWHA